ncbi:MAG: DeoR family transcriptional regulator [Chloroflexota bacterium]
MNSPSRREKRILEYLAQKEHVSIQELAAHLSVSLMTVHRDLNRLAAEGRVRKSHGEVSLATPGSQTSGCAMCGKLVVDRTAFMVNLGTGIQKRTCCAHCGLLLYQQIGGLPLAADFLHDYMVSAAQAIYLIQSDLTVCCMPSVFVFGERSEAEKFRLGFGGKLVDMTEAIRFLSEAEKIT